MEKLSTILMLYLLPLAIAMPMARGFDKQPGAVQAWFENLSNLKEKVARIHFYIHDMMGGKNPTTFVVAEANISATSATYFGLIKMTDIPIRVGPEPNSKIIGQIQGINGASSFEEIGLLLNLNFLFTEGEYNGSTLSILGRESELEDYREMPIVGGTGVFRLARGIVTSHTILINNTFEEIFAEVTAVVSYYVG
ncbi:hypothetical protein C2S52_006787 [Perilla frutescens var. hirtella]|nr:hypothetical protein C2S52_006787 [Perilla frutescens var. hirtella]